MNHFETLNKINVNDKVEKKNGLTYLSWAFGWSEVKKIYPDAFYIIKKFDGLPYVFDPKTGYMVFTEVTIEGHTHEMWLPVMDGANKAMKDEPYQYTVKQWQNGKKVEVVKDCDAADMFDINKTIMRCLVKNLAMFGLGLYIYAGEDLPEDEEQQPVKPHEPAKVTLTVAPAELEQRKREVKAIQKDHNISDTKLKEIAAEMGVKPLNSQTAQEYADFLVGFQNRIQ